MPTIPVAAAPGGVDDHVGHVPAELLRDLVSHRLLALGPVGLLQGRHVEQAALLGGGARRLARVGYQAVDQYDAGAGDLRLHAIGGRHVLRHEDVGLGAGAGGVRGDRAAGVTGRRYGEPGHAELHGPRHGGGQSARLERRGGIDPLVLDQQIRAAQSSSQSAGPDDGREALAQAHHVAREAHRHQLEVAPHVRGTRRQMVRLERSARGVEVVAGVEHLAARDAEAVELVGRERIAAGRAFEVR